MRESEVDELRAQIAKDQEDGREITKEESVSMKKKVFALETQAAAARQERELAEAALCVSNVEVDQALAASLFHTSDETGYLSKDEFRFIMTMVPDFGSSHLSRNHGARCQDSGFSV